MPDNLPAGLLVDCDGDVWMRPDINEDKWVCLTESTSSLPLDLLEAFGPLHVYEKAYELPGTP